MEDLELKEKINGLKLQQKVVEENLVKLNQISQQVQHTLHLAHPLPELHNAIVELETTMHSHAAMILRLETVGR